MLNIVGLLLLAGFHNTMEVAATSYINVALGKPVKQKDNRYMDRGFAEAAVDGNHNPNWFGNSCTHTTAFGDNWWMVDLLGRYKIQAVQLTNRDDNYRRLQNFSAYVSTNNSLRHGFPIRMPEHQCFYHREFLNASQTKTINCSRPLVGRYVMVFKAGHGALTLCEVEVLIDPNDDVDAAVVSSFNFAIHPGIRILSDPFYSVSGTSTMFQCSATCLQAKNRWVTIVQFNLDGTCQCIQESPLGAPFEKNRVNAVDWSLLVGEDN